MKYEKLKDVAEFINGLAFKPSDWKKKGKKIIRIQNLTDPEKPFNRTTKNVDKKYIVKTNDIMFSWSASLGIFIWNEKEDAVLNQHIFKVIPIDQNKIHKKYLVYCLRLVIDSIQNHLHGSTMKHINRGDLLDVKIPVPELSKQIKIGSSLDKIEKLSNKRKEILLKIDQSILSVFLDYFGDPLDKKQKFPIKKLNEIGKLERGISKHRPRNDPVLLDGPYPLIQTGDVSNSDKIINNFSKTYSEVGLKQSKLWPKGTLCITIAANIARTGVLGIDACFPDSIVGFTTNEKSTIEYVRVWLMFFQKKLEEEAPKSAQKNINLEILKNLEIQLPPLNMQKKFHEISEKIYSIKQKQIISLNKTEGLLKKVLSDNIKMEAFYG